METESFLQVASSFTSTPIERSLRSALGNLGVPDGVRFTLYSQMSEYMLGPASGSPQVAGTILLLRVEDWLRADLKSTSGDTSSAMWREQIKQQLRARIDEFIAQLKTLSNHGKEVWFLVCPSTGWISERYQLTDLFRTYTNLAAARARGIPHVTVLSWPVQGDVEDRSADRLGQIPYTQDAFDLLGRFSRRRLRAPWHEQLPLVRNQFPAGPLN